MNVASCFRMQKLFATARAMTTPMCLAVLLGTTGLSLGETQNSDPVIVNGTQLHESDLAVKATPKSNQVWGVRP